MSKKSTNSSIKLSIIIISYNTQEITLNCLKSLIPFLKSNYEVVILDNNSSDDSYKALKRFVEGKPKFKLIKSNSNIGFGGGNNLAVNNANGKYLLFLNSDTILIEDCLTSCLNYLEDHSNTVAVTCNLLNEDHSVQYTGGYFPTLWRVFAWQFFLDDLPIIGSFVKSIHPHQPGFNPLSKFLKDFSVYSEGLNISNQALRHPDWITGAFFMLPREAFLKVKGFDPSIFMYAEEMELCYRLRKEGKQITFYPQSSIIHLGGKSSGASLAISGEIKGMLQFFKLHKPSWQLPLAKTFFFFGSLLRLIIFGIIKNNETARRAYLAAFANLT